MSTFGIRLFCAAFLLCSCGFFQQSHASRDAVFGLCDVDDVISARNGSLVVTKGVDCTKVILAPPGWRIKFTLYEIRNFDAVTSIHDGGTVVDTRKYDYGKGFNVPTSGPPVYYSSSNALLVHTAKISSRNPKFNATFEMFTHSRDNCLCPPTMNAETVCTFPIENTRFFYSDEDLKKTCTASCKPGHGTGVYKLDHSFNFVRSIVMNCQIGTPSWVPNRDAPTFDPELVSCTNVLPATQVFSVYKFAYANIACNELNKTAIQSSFYLFLVNNKSTSYSGECFKQPIGNCTVSEPVLLTCVPKENKNDSLITIDIQDNVEIAENTTVTQELFNSLNNDFASSNFHDKVERYVKNDLVINNVAAVNFQHSGFYTNCPTNQVTTSESPRKCISCPLHNFKKFYPKHFSSTCEKCPADQRRLLNESMCVNGTKVYPSKPSNTYCVHKCPLGKFFSNESGICEWCDYGFFQNSTTNLNPVCHPCPDGNTTAFVGAKSEKNCMYRCSEGQFTKFPSCFNCNIGYYMPYKGNRFSKCFKCPPGNTTLIEGTANKTDCVDQCSLGEYFNISLGACVLCPNNTYQDEQGPGNTRSCKTCPANTVTLTTGSSSKTACLGPCSAGEYLDVKVRQCKQCPIGRYDDSNQTNFMCKRCPEYKITENKGSNNVTQCTYNCKKGEFFNLTSKACEKCANMTYQDNIGQDSCKPCVGNTFTLKLGSKRCIAPCSRGKFLNKSVEACQDCPHGYFQNKTDYVLTMCSPCPLDNYADKLGSHVCTACPKGGLTLVTAATGESECIELCDRGYYLNKALRSCEKCLKGYYQDKQEYRNESCTMCPSANLTTLESGAKSEEDCVGYCASSPCRNGGKCSNLDNDFNCSCPDHLAGKQCQSITDIKNADIMEISVQFTTLVWNNNLSSHDSREFMKLASQIENAVRDEFKNDVTLRTVKVKEFTPGSVISELQFHYVAGTEFKNPFDTLTSAAADGKIGSFPVNASSINIANYTCGTPLGMENGRIPDNAISSGNRNNYHPFKNARLNHNGPGWTPQVLYIKDAYLQVDFGEVVQLTGIATQGSSYDGGQWLRAYYFTYSIDGVKWLEYRERPKVPKVSLEYCFYC